MPSPSFPLARKGCSTACFFTQGGLGLAGVCGLGVVMQRIVAGGVWKWLGVSGRWPYFGVGATMAGMCGSGV